MAQQHPLSVVLLARSHHDQREWERAPESVVIVVRKGKLPYARRSAQSAPCTQHTRNTKRVQEQQASWLVEAQSRSLSPANKMCAELVSPSSSSSLPPTHPVPPAYHPHNKSPPPNLMDWGCEKRQRQTDGHFNSCIRGLYCPVTAPDLSARTKTTVWVVI